jgi:uncharacterized membrane protein
MCWISLALLGPLAAHLNWAVTPYVYSFFSSVCHQSAERCFYLLDQPLAVCARCTGLYCGFLLGFIIFPLIPRFCRTLLRRPRLIILFAVPMGVDLLIENTLASRYLSGLIASFPIALFVWIAVEELGGSFHRFIRRNP